MTRVLAILAAAAALAALFVAPAAQARSYTYGCRLGNSTFRMRFPITTGSDGKQTFKVARSIAFRATHVARGGAEVWIMRKGPSRVFHGTNKPPQPNEDSGIQAGGESVYGDYKGVRGGGVFRPIDMQQLLLHPLPFGRYRDESSKTYDVLYQYLVDFFPSGKPGHGCGFRIRLFL